MSDTDRISKTQRKREMHALQDLGEQLVTLSSEQLRQVKLPDGLLEAITHARTLNKFGARRRQLQYIGRLMRDVETAPIQNKLDSWNSVSKTHTAYLHLLEKWRKRLLEDETSFTEFAKICPRADIQRLRALVRNSHQEQLANKPPKSYRALFKELHSLIPEMDSHALKETNFTPPYTEEP